MSSDRKTVVIVGGSFAGTRVYKHLQHEFNTIIVDPKDFFEFTPLVLRAMVEPESIPHILIPQVKNAVQARVTEIEPQATGGSLVLSTGQKLKYDYCVISTGSTYNSPMRSPFQETPTIATRTKELEAAAALLASASRIMVVGGGAVGVELAAEIVGKFGSSKTCILVSSSEKLLPRMPDPSDKIARDWLVKNGVQIISGCRMQNAKWDEWSQLGNHEVDLGKGSKVTVDLVYCCLGSKVHTELLAGLPFSKEDKERCAGRGFPTEDTLQIKGQERVFACGDCVLNDLEASGFTTHGMGNLVANNIRRHAAGEQLLLWPEGESLGSKVNLSVAAISLWKYAGVLRFNSQISGGLVAAGVKWFVEHVIVGYTRGRWGYWQFWRWNEWFMNLASLYVR